MSTRLILILNFFCDRQNLNENQKNGNACPWYSSGDSRHSKLTLNFSIKVKLELQDINIQVNDFTSHKFSQYFLKTPFQSTSSYNEWDHMEKFITLVQKVNSFWIMLIKMDIGKSLVGPNAVKSTIKVQSERSKRFPPRK